MVTSKIRNPERLKEIHNIDIEHVDHFRVKLNVFFTAN